MVDTKPWTAALDRAGYSITEPRRAVAEMVAERDSHFTAPELVLEAKRRRLGVGRATVLRAPLLLGLLLVAGCAGPAGSPTLSARPPAATASSPTSSSGSAEPTPVDSGPPLPVLGTENFYADLLAQVGGSRVAASSLLNDPNADPHAFESSPQSGALVADSRLVIVNGLGYDAFMQKLLAASNRPDRVVINVQQLLG